MTEQRPSNQMRHQCAVQLFDGVPCDMEEHNGLGCTGCVPYVHSDLTVDHEPNCTATVITVETTNE